MRAPTTAYLDVHEVHRTFHSGATQVHALRGVSLTAAPGELVAVRGRSGSGKTTLLNVIGGLDRPDAGRVVLDGADVTAMSDAELLAVRRGTVAYVFQSFGLVPILTARENVGIPLRLNEVDPTEREDRVAAALEHVGLSGHGAVRHARRAVPQDQLGRRGHDEVSPLRATGLPAGNVLVGLWSHQGLSPGRVEADDPARGGPTT